MRAGWKIVVTFTAILTTFCAKPKSEWLRWQESLDLAYPNALSFKIDMQKKVFYEGEQLVLRMLIINKIDMPRTIVYTGNRTSRIAGGLQTFKVVTESDSVLMYSPQLLVSIIMRPEDEIVLGPHDTLYSHAILCPDLFRQYAFPMERVSLLSGNYIIESEISLGTKFYPRPGRGLRITSHPTMFSIEPLPAEEWDHLSEIRPYVTNFFGNSEECLFSLDGDQEEYADSALFWLDMVRNTSSHFALIADFVYTCVPAVTRRTHGDTVKLNRAISEARKFVEKYDGSILAEEMEFKLAEWLLAKDSTSTDFYEQAKKVIEEYPQNINSFGIKKHLRKE